MKPVTLTGNTRELRATLPLSVAMEQVYLSILAVDQGMAIGVKQHAVVQSVRATIHTPDDVVIVPAGLPADRVPAQGTFTLLSPEETEYLPPITQLVLHPLDPQRLPFQLLRRIIRVVAPG